MEKFDVVIIGAGIVGLSVARALITRDPSIKILICEKESEPGLHASSRNSGVLHAGFYYSPESLKAKFCRIGNSQLRDFIQQNDLPILETGKVVITKSQEEEARLFTLFNRGVANQVKLELLPASDLQKFEPLAVTHENFLWSPTTAVSDPRALLKALVQELISSGVEIRCSSEINDFDDQKAKINGIETSFKHLVNSAGSQAVEIAHKFKVGGDYLMVPFIGMYRYVPQNQIPIKTLVYPVPHPVNPFLGVHFTLTSDGMVKIGPTAIPIIGKEQYKILNGFSLSDLKSASISFGAIAAGSHHSLLELVRSEFPKYSTRFLVSEAAKLVPSVAKMKGWKIKPPGIRSQLVNRNTGELVQDFILEKATHSTHVLNTVSPGWTSALAFGEHISSQVFLEL
jgi:L-2-hydroxyglutarate oxidase